MRRTLLLATLSILSLLLPALTPRGVHAAPARHATQRPTRRWCGFRSSVWWIVDDTTFSNKVAEGNFSDTDAVDRTREQRSEAYNRIANRYGWPSGSQYLAYVLGQIWDDIREQIYWNNLFSAETDSDSMSYDEDQQNQAEARGNEASQSAWWAVKHTC